MTSYFESLQGVAALPHLGVIRASGADAANFLHNQLTQDVLLLPVGQARLAAFCNAKGRVQASFVLLKISADDILLVLSRDLLAQTLKRLSMFVLRAKVKLADVSDDGQVSLRGLLGAAACAGAGSDNAQPWQVTPVAGGYQVALYPAQVDGLQVPRHLWVGLDDAPVPQGLAVSEDIWRWSEVMSGVGLIGQAVFEAFVPQMLNYESVGGVNFKKGCYPGQEVVARSQFRGTLKRRTALAHSPVALMAGQEIFTPADLSQPCATVVMCAPRPDGQGFDALVSGTLESMGAGWQTQDGQPLSVLGLPYALLEDI